ncbi:TetR/AcrR family transcriptional regulator [Variovorax sp. J31P207]|uniref:TetR/AcrR family transcriptional regulator n=1 Tax=Variovorax sp. J31P207 TaxID=3053510 RepID=UPI002576438E|nr:TetR/AcrR family transcriptional regulator [Variovorax sp. J31P207]MDM0069971.1 TetR/AcrR family transcriptional regulator [Variovorax sp. J31P207]
MERDVTKRKHAPDAPARTPEVEDAERPSNAREVILREAAILFSTKGYAESGLREIAEMAGIRSSTVYYYFASKDRIYEEIIRLAIDATIESVMAQLAALPRHATPRMRIEAAIAGHLLALHANKPFTSTNAQSRMTLPEEVNAVIQPMRERYSAFWRDLLDAAAAAGCLQAGLEPRMLRPLILGTLNRTVGWFDSNTSPIEKLVRTTVITFSGIWCQGTEGAPDNSCRAEKATKATKRRSA